MMTPFLRFTLIAALSVLLFQQKSYADLTEMEQAKLWFDSGEKQKALELLKKVYLREQTYDFGFSYAYYLNLAGQSKEAIQVYDTLIHSEPKRYEADLELAYVYERLGASETSVVVLERAIKRGGYKDLNIISKYASIQLQAGNTDIAVNILKRYRPKREERVKYLGIWGASNFDHGNYQEALVAYNELVRLKPEVKEFHYLLANTYRQVGQYARAEVIYEDLKKEFPEDAKIWFESGLLLSQMGRFDEALLEIKEAQDIYTLKENLPKIKVTEEIYDEILLQKARSLMAEQDFKRACALLNQLYMRSSEKKDGLQAAYCFITSNQFEAADIIYAGLIKDFPSEIEIYLEYYDVLRREHLEEKARALLERYVELYGYSEPKIISRLASAYIAEENYNSALNILHVGQPPNQQPYLSFLFLSGIAHNALRDPDRALQQFKKAVAIAPELIGDPEDLLVTIQEGKNIDYQGIILFETYDQLGLSPAILVKRASFYLVLKNWEKAMEDANTILNDITIPEDSYLRNTAKALISECKIGQGLEHYEKGELGRSIEIFQEIYLQDPSPRNAFNYAYFSSVINQSNRSEVILRNLKKTHPDHTEIGMMMGEILLSEHRADEALRHLDVNVGFNHIYDERSSPLLLRALYAQGLLEEMEETLEAIRVLKGDLPLHLKPYEAALQVEYGNFPKVLEIWQEIAEENPEDSSAQLEVISSFMKLQRYEDAEFLYQQLLLKFDKEPAIWLNWTRFLLHRNRISEAQLAGDKAKELLAEERTDFWANLDRLLLLGQVQATLREFDEAEATFQQILELAPYHFQAHNQLAYLYLEKGDFYQAEEYFLKTEKLQPKNPFTKPAIASIYMRAHHPGKSRYWELKAISNAKRVNHGVENLKSDSLGVFGYRPVPDIGTRFSFARITARPNAMMLVRETLFSDQPLAGFEIDQTIFKGSVGYFAPQLPGFWFNYNHIQNSNTLETKLNLFEPQVHGALNFPEGLLQIKPKATLLFENFKTSQQSQVYGIGSIELNWRPSSSPWTFGNQTVYGSQRVDNFQVPGIFFSTAATAFWKKGEKSVGEEISYRYDKTSEGIEFTTFITGTAYRQKVGSSLFLNTYVRTETLFTSDSTTVFGLEPIISAETNFFSQNALPYLSFHPSFSIGGDSTMRVFQYEWGIIYQNKRALPTKVDDDWYQYKIPYRMRISLQRALYPNLSVEPSQTLLFTFQAI